MAWIVMGAAIAGGILPVYFGRQAQYVQADRERMADRVAIGKWLKEHYPGKTIALNAAGAIPFYSESPAIDMLGLNDRHIARRPVELMGQGVAGHEKFDPDYVLQRRPDIIFVGRNELTMEPNGVFIWLEGDRRLIRHPQLQRDYRLETTRVGFEYFTFYLRKDLKRP